jgi:RNA 2',3'-cyclic 3'-phosphodiesterase
MSDRAVVSDSPHERVRLFVALELPERVVSACARWGDEIVRREPGLRAVPPASLHITLCFLGWRTAGEVGDIVAACGVAGTLPAATLAADRAIWLPPRRPRVLTLALADEDGRLADAQAALSRALEAGGWYVPESRPFLAHVTVARVGRGARVRPRELTAPALDPFRGSRVTVFRSRLSRSGARYERLASIDLLGGARAGTATTSGEATARE